MHNEQKLWDTNTCTVTLSKSWITFQSAFNFSRF